MRKLFAVVALATATPAVAGPEHAHHKHAEVTPIASPAADPWAGPATATASTAATAPIPGAIAQAILALFGISLPRTLPSGAPACGNLGAKSQARADCERARR
ncbi:MAG TPA: hypothetical protein VIU61_15610 [Kofleriaceae bacterium]